MSANSTEDRVRGEKLYEMLERHLPPGAAPRLSKGFSGDPEAAFSLVVATPNDQRGIIAVAAYLLEVPNPGFREIVRSVWQQDHVHMRPAAFYLPRDGRGGLHHIRRMFKRGSFPVPFTEEVTIYRGHPIRDQAYKGLSWTTDRDCACWYRGIYFLGR